MVFSPPLSTRFLNFTGKIVDSGHIYPVFLIAKYTSKLIENTHPNSHPNSHPNIFLPLKQMPQSIKTGSKRLLPVQFS